MLEVEFYFELSCPWTYLAAGRLREAAMRTGARIVWKAIRLEQVDPDAAARRWPEDPRRAAYARTVLQDWARYCDVALRLPADWPGDVSLASRGAVFAIRAGRAADYVIRAYAAEFGTGQALDDAGVLEAVAVDAGLPAAEFRAALEDPAGDRVLEQHGAELLSRGGFGSATMFVGEQMFWGNESMPLVEFALGQASGRQFVMPGQHG